VIPSAILGRYARSLADVAFEEKIEDDVIRDLKTFNELFATVPDVLRVFGSPAVAQETKVKVLEDLMDRYPVHKITSNFFRILLQHNRIGHFSGIVELFLKSANERRGVLPALVTTAAPLSPEESKMIEDRLTVITGKSVTVKARTDHTLLGGMMVHIGSTVFDGSLRTRFAEMRRRLAE
jgi:F-type H+-transporting ATPase subunit delta